jgi:hypothetical protein
LVVFFRKEHPSLLPNSLISLYFFSDRHSVLLCHKFLFRVLRWQHGQRGKLRAMARAMAIRMEVIEFGTWRSGLIGGSAGSIISV